MWIIKNRVTGEYERKGQSKKRDKVSRAAWATLAHAKCHVCDSGFDKWFMDADFIEITEEGTGRVIPVVDYMRDHVRKSYRPSKYVKRMLGMLDEQQEDIGNE